VSTSASIESPEVYDAFISYSTKNANFIKPIEKDLREKYELKIWFDQGEMKTASLWDQLQKAIEDSNNFVYFVSPASVNSFWCNRELEYARRLGKHIIPIEYQEIDEAKIIAKSMKDEWIALVRENWLSIRHIHRLKMDESIDIYAATYQLFQTLRENTNEATQFQAWFSHHVEDWRKNNGDLGLLLNDNDLQKVYTWQNANQLTKTQKEYIERQKEYIEKSESHSEAIKEQRDLLQRLRSMIFIALLMFNDAIRRQRVFLQRLRLAIFVALFTFLVLFIGTVFLFIQARQIQSILTISNVHSIGTNLYGAGFFDEALQYYSDALASLNPDKQPWTDFATKVYTDLGIHINVWLHDECLAYAQLNNYLVAEKSCQAITNLFPDYKPPHFTLAIIYRNLGVNDPANFSKAYEELNKVQNPNYACDDPAQHPPDFENFIACLRRGSVAYAEGNYALALSILENPNIYGYPLTPNLSAYQLDMLYYIAMSYLQEKNTSKACDYFREYEDTQSTYPPVIRIVGDRQTYQDAAQQILKCSN
jgi:hypothetical protein